MEEAPSYAWLWNNPELSNGTIELHTTQPVAAPSRSSATGGGHSHGRRPLNADTAVTLLWRLACSVVRLTRRRRSSSSAQAARPPAARTFPCHSAVLASNSTYFRRRLTGDGSSSSGGGGGSSSADVLGYSDAGRTHAAGGGRGAAAPGLLLAEHVEEEELDAMEAVLRSCYCGTLVEDGSSPSRLDTAMLLQMLVLSDRFDVVMCQQQCWTELARRGAAGFQVAAINTVLCLGAMPTGVYAHAGRNRAVTAATCRLLELLGDCEAVCSSWHGAAAAAAAAVSTTVEGGSAAASGGDLLHEQLLQLSLAALLALLQEDGLKARSENSVLLLADAWVSGPAGAACSKAQLRQVAQAVRLGQLTTAFTFSVLPELPWVQATPEELRSLMLFCVAGHADGAARQAELLSCRSHSRAVAADCLVGPAAWYNGRTRVAWAGPQGLFLRWQLTQQQLAALLAVTQDGLSQAFGALCFFNGFSVAPTLIVSRSPGGPFATFGLAVAKVHRGGGSGLRCFDLKGSVTVELSSDGTPEVHTWEGTLRSGWSQRVATPAAVPPSQALDVDVWASYLVDGVMHVKCTLAAFN